jgi:molecular chaperone GrpE
MPKQKDKNTQTKTKARKTKAAEIEELKSEVATLKDQLMRGMADMENLRKRSQKEVGDASKYAITNFARDLLEVLDNLYRAKENVPDEEVENNEILKTLCEGVTLTKTELIKTFEKYGIKRITPLGEKFDHNFHQAVVQIEDANAEPGDIVQVIQAGYVMQDRLLRPAMVGVAKAAS